jgi:pectin methylesterase-like acyl-CoA thioesterase
MRIYSIIAILLLTGSAQAATISVCHSGCEYSSIQASIDAASPGDAIEVQGGTYNEDVVINKNIQLVNLGTVVVKKLFTCGHKVQGSLIANIVSDSCNPEVFEGHVSGSKITIGGETTADDTTITVCPNGCDFSSIQAAIDNSNPGDIIQVYSGGYNEQVFINKDIILKGIDTGSGEPVVRIISRCGHPESVIIGIKYCVMKSDSSDSSGSNIKCPGIP